MFKNLLTALFLAGLCSTSGSAQIIATQQTMKPGRTQDAGTSDVCVSVRHFLEKIIVKQNGKQFEITLGGGACEPPGSGISDLWVQHASRDNLLDVVEASDCPAFQTRVDELWRSKPHSSRERRYKTNAIPIGDFIITDSHDLFDLENKAGRRAAALWIKQTLEAVRPCWNTVRQDRTRSVVDSLYEALSLSPP